MKTLLALTDTLARLNAAQSPRQLFAAVKEFSASLGYLHFALAFAPTAGKTLNESMIYSDSRKQRIDDLDKILPYTRFDVVAKASTHRAPFTIKELQKELGDPNVGYALPELLKSGENLIVPVFEGYELKALAMFSGHSPELAPVARSMLLLLTYRLFECHARLKSSSNRTEPGDFSEREMLCLTYLGRGMTDQQVSQLMGISPRTVRFHLDSVKSKLEATSRVQAIARAMQLGLISV